MVRSECCVPGCSNNSTDNPGLDFHHFPRSYDRRRKWMENIGKLEMAETSWSTVKSLKICGLHFTSNQYRSPLTKKLNIGAIPTIFMPEPEVPLALSPINPGSLPTQLGARLQGAKQIKSEVRSTETPEQRDARLNSARQHMSKEKKKETSILDRGIEFVDVDSSKAFVDNSEPIDYKPNVLSKSINMNYSTIMKLSNIQHYEYLNDENQKQFIIKTEIDIKEEIL